MSSVVFDGRTVAIPEAFVKFIIEHSVSDLGVYKGADHTFADPYLNPRFGTDWDAIYTIGQTDYHFDRDLCNQMVAQVCKERNSAAPKRSAVDSVSNAGDNGLKPLQELQIEEENGSITVLVYVGRQRFYVLSTNRSTLAPGDILESVSMPIGRGEVELFNLYRNGKPYKPKEAEIADVCYFKTGILRSITLVDSPVLLKIVDNDPSYGGSLRTVTDKNAEEYLSGFIQFVKSMVEPLGALPEREEFPEYRTILEVAMDSGVSTFLCNEIISAVERRSPYVDAFNEDDWDLRISDRKKAEINYKVIALAYPAYSEAQKALEKICKDVRARRFLLFFKKSGSFNEADRERAEELARQMEENAGKIQAAQKELREILARNNRMDKKFEVALDLHVEPAYGKSMIQDALEKSKVPPTYNLKQGAKVFSVLAALIVVLVLIRMTTGSVDRFNKEADNLAPLLEQAEFGQAVQQLRQARDDFRPGFMRFLINGRLHRANDEIQAAIDHEVDEGIEQLETLLRATHGRFTPEMLEHLSKMLQWRPDNPRLLELKEQYMRN
ncbi:MAG: hypothetical protein IJP49_11260 [Bacteroidales bacterium]|nr:hypothetical protein [Bacteroidales bacterium]